MTALAVTAGARADDCFSEGARPYRVIEIDQGAIGPPANLDLPLGVSSNSIPIRRLTFGMNRHLEFVFFAPVSSVSGGVRAFVHLPVDAYGLDAGTHELPVPSTAPGAGVVVVAVDINDDGVIVGFVGDAVSFEELSSGVIEAFVWRLADSTQSSPAAIQTGESIHPTSLDLVGCKSAAWGVNNADPPVIVGAAAERFCDWPACVSIDPVYAFAKTLGTPSSAVWLPRNAAGISRAYAANSTSPPLAVGLSGGKFMLDAPLEQPCGPPAIGYPCPWEGDPPAPVNPDAGITWFLSGSPSLGLLTSLVGAEASGAGAGVDDAGHIVGDSGCPSSRRATFWEDFEASPFDLAAVCGGDASTAIGRADDVVTVFVCDEEEELVIVVGGDVADGGRVWGRFDSLWCCEALSDRVLPISTVSVDGEYDIEYAHAVAPSGQMIVHGRPRGVTSPPPFSAYFLTCAADFNGDGRVDGADLGELLNLWGPCPSSGPCPGNLNPEHDDVVDGADLGILLNSWSGEEPCTVWPGVTCPTSMFAGGMSSEDAFAMAIGFLGFTDADDLAAWFATADELSRDAVLVSIMSIMAAAQSATEE